MKNQNKIVNQKSDKITPDGKKGKYSMTSDDSTRKLNDKSLNKSTAQGRENIKIEEYKNKINHGNRK